MTHKAKLFRGLTAVFCALTIILANVSVLAFQNRGSISRFLGIESASSGELTVSNTRFKTDFSEDGVPTEESAKALVKAMDQYVIDVAEEGAVLLRNENKALPLANGAKITLFGAAMTKPIYRGISNGASFSLIRGISFQL